MRNKFLLLFTFVILFGCKKETIDVSLIHQTDSMGNPLAATQLDSQWLRQQFTQEEMDLFTPLDTASLQGTYVDMPVDFNAYIPPYPNPFQSILKMSLATVPSPLNAVVFKYVILDKNQKIVKRGVSRPPFINNMFIAQILPNFSPGKYRMYVTYSAEGRENFFTTWGYIQKLP